MKFTKSIVKSWMIKNKSKFLDKKTNELEITKLVEAAARAFNEDYGDGPLDDPNHWIWEIATEI